MFRLIFIIVCMAVAILAGVWVDYNISSIDMTILDYSISVHPLLLLSAIIAFYVITTFFISLVASFMRLPKAISAFFMTKQIRNAKPLNDLILAVKNWDIKSAEKLLIKVRAAHSDPLIEDILHAKIYELKGEAKNAINIYSKCTSNAQIKRYANFKIAKLNFWLNNIETAYVHFKTLIPDTQSKETLRFFVITGLKINKHEEIITLLESKKNSKVFDANIISQILSYVYAQQALITYHNGIYDEALELSKIANDIRPDFISAEIQISSAIKLNELKSAMKLLLKHLHLLNEKNLYSFISILNKQEKPKNVYSYFKVLQDSKNSNSMIILAKCAIDCNLYDEANSYITQALDESSNIANLLMAEYCLKTHGNASEAFMWFERYSTQADYITTLEFQQIQQEIYNILYAKNT